jgi:pantothenate kinase-related protein Tda10
MESSDTHYPLVIGIAGASRSGKNTVADMIQAEATRRGLRVVQFAFADRLKKVVAAMFE